MAAVRGAQINKLIDIVEHAAFAENGRRNEIAAHHPDRQSVGLSPGVNLIRRRPRARSLAVIDDHVRAAWNVLLEKGRDRATAHVSRAAGRKTKYHRDRLALVEWGLGYNRRGRQRKPGDGQHGHE